MDTVIIRKFSIKYLSLSKAKMHFFDSHWRELYMDCSGLEELTERISTELDREFAVNGLFYSPHIDGFSQFIRDRDNGCWKSTSDDYGEIIVSLTTQTLTGSAIKQR